MACAMRRNVRKLGRSSRFFFLFLVISLFLFLFVVFAVQKSHNRALLTEQLSAFAAALSTAIPPEHVHKILQQKSADHSSYKIITERLEQLERELPANSRAEIVHFSGDEAFLLVPSVQDRNRTPFAKFSPSEEYMRAIGQAAQSREVVCSQIYKNGGSSYVTVFAPIVDEKEAVEAALAIQADIRHWQTAERKQNVILFLLFALLMAGLYFFYKHETKKVLRFGVQKTKELEQLKMAETMNALAQLAASVAHEIRNPLTVVKGFLQIFLSKEKLTAEEHTYVKLMIEEMNRAESIINDYLSLAKPDIKETEKFSAGQFACKVMGIIHSYAMMAKNIEIKTIVEEEFDLLCNKNELRQVLINILKNGIEAMKDGGTLTLRVYKDSRYGIFEVRDTGVGMTKEELKQLGMPYFTRKEKGTGIGLTVCWQIISRMNGKIEVESEKGKGTVFRIKVPLEKGEVSGS